MNPDTLTRYRKIRRNTPMLPARYALSWAKQPDASQDWDEEGEHFTREVDGFTLTLRVVIESVYPAEGEGLGSYMREARETRHYHDEMSGWRGNYPEPAETFPLGLPYTSFRYEGCNRRGDAGYFVPDGIEDTYKHLRQCGQSRAVAWELTREDVETQVSEFFGAPLTNCVVIVEASREGVKLGSSAMGTSYLDNDEGRADPFVCAEECGMVDEAIEEARATLARLTS